MLKSFHTFWVHQAQQSRFRFNASNFEFQHLFQLIFLCKSLLYLQQEKFIVMSMKILSSNSQEFYLFNSILLSLHQADCIMNHIISQDQWEIFFNLQFLSLLPKFMSWDAWFHQIALTYPSHQWISLKRYWITLKVIHSLLLLEIVIMLLTLNFLSLDLCWQFILVPILF